MPDCPICGAESKIIHNGTRDNPHINVFECKECLLKFLDPLVESVDYERGEMYSNSILDNSKIDSLKIEFSSDTNRRVENTKLICRDKSVLDFGCGYGFYLEEMSKYAKSVCGVELGDAEHRYCGSKGLTVKKNISDFNQRFDVITLFHVLEHLSNPRSWLKTFADKLNDQGVLVIEVPNATDALFNLYEVEKFADFSYWSAHLFLYSSNSLNKLIYDTDLFEIIEGKQIQRYGLANHLMWLAKGEPGGHKKWAYLDTSVINEEYERILQENQLCDTLFYVLRKK